MSGSIAVTKEIEQKIRQCLQYNPDTGELVWKVSPGRRVKAGDRAGGRHRDGYRRVRVSGRKVMEHRVVWFLARGTWPPEQIDHINGVRDDNRLVNLRLATHSENSRNRPEHRAGRLPYAHPKGNRWQSRVWEDRNMVYIGTYPTDIQAYRAAMAYLRESEALP